MEAGLPMQTLKKRMSHTERCMCIVFQCDKKTLSV